MAPTDEELRRTFAAELKAVRGGGRPDPDSCLDPETKGALTAIARAHPDAHWSLVDTAHEVFTRFMSSRPRRATPPRGPIRWSGDTAYRDGAVVGSVRGNGDYEMPRFHGEGGVRWETAGSSFEALVGGEPIGTYGSQAAARAAVESWLR